MSRPFSTLDSTLTTALLLPLVFSPSRFLLAVFPLHPMWNWGEREHVIVEGYLKTDMRFSWTSKRKTHHVLSDHESWYCCSELGGWSRRSFIPVILDWCDENLWEWMFSGGVTAWKYAVSELVNGIHNGWKSLCETRNPRIHKSPTPGTKASYNILVNIGQAKSTYPTFAINFGFPIVICTYLPPLPFHSICASAIFLSSAFFSSYSHFIAVLLVILPLHSTWNERRNK